ncbi:MULTISPECIES: 30S ribosome-binding factor RbfA [Roseomonadaceae]|uniref:Ribosome-binding factor A n=1 Tax=Falsiroseomonas oleicola TaxID=2801474 RepID=A0ABS6HCG2_9PROT|nr:30S ribosome-binding factor RbfA [Roseomonas oleicola]MBU8546394.1 30S ribosome-binding factor RbfA [Roseomonas oleicola]
MARKTRDAADAPRRDKKPALPRATKSAPRKGGAEGPSQRQLRVAEEIRHALSAIFAREEFRDPDLFDLKVTVTEVRASPDLQHMTAFVSGLGRDLSPAQLAGLKRIQPFLRSQVAKAVRLRTAPELHFQPDTALEYAMHISKVMQQPVVQQDLAKPAEPTPAEPTPAGTAQATKDSEEP